MTDPLPPDLLGLERELAARPQPDPPAELRSRILSAVERERPGLRTRPAPRGFGRFAAATAAAALLAINLSASVANDTDWHLATPPENLREITANIRVLDPSLSDRDALRQALLLHTAAGLAPAPVPVPPADRILSNKDLE